MNWHEHSAQDALRELQVTPQAGLDAAEAAARQEKYGKNRIRAAGRRSTPRTPPAFPAGAAAGAAVAAGRAAKAPQGGHWPSCLS